MTIVEVGTAAYDAFSDLSGMPGLFVPGITSPCDFEMDLNIIVWVE